jgi:hypothetical protein
MEKNEDNKIESLKQDLKELEELFLICDKVNVKRQLEEFKRVINIQISECSKSVDQTNDIKPKTEKITNYSFAAGTEFVK